MIVAVSAGMLVAGPLAGVATADGIVPSEDEFAIECADQVCSISVNCDAPDPLFRVCFEIVPNSGTAFIPAGNLVSAEADVNSVDVYLHDYHYQDVDYPCVSSDGNVKASTDPGTGNKVPLSQDATCLPGGFSHSKMRLLHLGGGVQGESGVFGSLGIVKLCDADVTVQAAGFGPHDRRVPDAVPC